MQTSFKAFIEFVTILLLFYVLFFGPEAGGILVPQPGIQPEPFALEGKALTHGPPGKSLNFFNRQRTSPVISSCRVLIVCDF